jgi:hypothetical protein
MTDLGYNDVSGDNLFDVTTCVDGGTPYAVVAYKESTAGQIRWRWFAEAGGAAFAPVTAETPFNVVSVQTLYDVTSAAFRIACTYQIAGGNIRSEFRNTNSAVYTAPRLLLAPGDIDARNITCVEDPSLDAAAPGVTSTIRWYIEFLNDVAGWPGGGATPWFYYIRQIEDSFAGGAVAEHDRIRNCGLASKAFLYEGKARVWICYDTTLQKSLFLTQAKTTTDARYDARALYMRGGGITAGPGLPQVVNPSGFTFLTCAIRVERVEEIKDDPDGVEFEVIEAVIGIAVTFGGNALDREELGPTKTICSGGYVGDFDGKMQELNFHLFPEEVGTDNVAGGDLPDDTYNYRCHYEWMDRKGQVHRSAVSPIYTGTAANPNQTVRHYVPCLHKGEVDKLGGPTWSAGKTHYTSISIFREWTDGLYHKISQAWVENDITVPYVTINDSAYDISANEILYTEGGILEDYGPPETRICTVRQNRLFIVPEEDRELIWYSKEKVHGNGIQFSPFLTRRISEGGEIIAIADLDEKLIIFKKREIHAFSGRGPSPTGEGPQFTETYQITTDVGCIDRRSVVRMDKGVMFQSEKGIYLLTRGLEAQYIGAPVEAYTRFNIAIKAHEVNHRNQVRFLLINGDMLVYDTLVNQWSVYTAAAWGGLFLQDSVVWSNDYHFLDNTGMVHAETLAYTDNNVYIPMLVETAWFNLAGLQGFQRIDWISLLGDWQSPHTLTVDVFIDYVTGLVPAYTKTINAATSSAPYQYRFKPRRGFAKCEAFKLRISDADAGAGTEEGLSLSGIAIDYKVKKGLYKQSTSRTL